MRSCVTHAHMVRGVARLAPHITATRGSGVWVSDTDGRSYMDLTSGIGALSTGHCHPRVVKAVQKQAATLVHAQQNCVGSHPPLQELTSRLLTSTRLPPALDSIYFGNTGTEAVENAVKLARRATRRPNVIGFMGGFHGRSFGGMSLSTAKVSCRQGFAPLLPGIYHVPYPEAETDVEPALQQLSTLFDRACAPEDTAAVIVEPVLGEGGVRRVHPAYMRRLRQICDETGMLLIADEVQSGCGRTGQWWGHLDWGEDAQPDIVTFGKGVASGYPLSGTVAPERLFDRMHANSLGGTFNGNAVAAAAANATLDVLDCVDDVAAKGERLAESVRVASPAAVGEVRQYGLMLAIQMKDWVDPKAFAELVGRAPDFGLLVLTSGVTPTVRLLPPLTITDGEIEQAADRLVAWLGSCPSLGV